jgi:hypothetical protein
MIKTIVILLCCACAASAQTTQPAKMTRNDAIALLRCTEFFTSDAVGYAAVVPGQVHAFNVILKEPDAKQVFATLQREASPEGQLFGMCGLYVIDRETFDKLLPEYRKRHGTVQTMIGCIVSDDPVRVVIQDIASGSYPNAFVAAGKRAAKTKPVE